MPESTDWSSYLKGKIYNTDVLLTEDNIPNVEYRNELKKVRDESAELHSETVGGVTEYTLFVKETSGDGLATIKKLEFSSRGEDPATGGPILKEWAVTPEQVSGLLEKAGFRVGGTSLLKDIARGVESHRESEMKGKKM